MVQFGLSPVLDYRLDFARNTISYLCKKINCLFKTDGSMGYNGGFNYEEDIDDVIVSVCCDIFSM